MGDLEERKRVQRLEQAIRNAITRLNEHDHALADGVCVVPKRGVCIVLEDLEKALLEDFAEEKAPREEEEDNVAYSFAGVELEVECSLCGGQGVVPSEAWSKWTKQWLDAEKLDPIPNEANVVWCPLCRGKRRAITDSGAKLIEFIERWVR